MALHSAFCIEGTVNKLAVIDCGLELTFHISSELFSLIELAFSDS